MGLGCCVMMLDAPWIENIESERPMGGAKGRECGQTSPTPGCEHEEGALQRGDAGVYPTTLNVDHPYRDEGPRPKETPSCRSGRMSASPCGGMKSPPTSAWTTNEGGLFCKFMLQVPIIKAGQANGPKPNNERKNNPT